MNRGYTRMSTKLYGSFKMSQIQQKLFAHEALPSKWSPVFSEKLDLSQFVPPEQSRTVSYKWYTTICLSVVFQEIWKTNRQDRLLFTTTIRVLTHWIKQLHFWALKTSIWWIIRRIILIWHRMTFFNFFTVKINERSTFIDSCRSGWCVQNSYLEDTSIRVAKVLWQLIQTHASV